MAATRDLEVTGIASSRARPRSQLQLQFGMGVAASEIGAHGPFSG
jgi:hypothetical protein